MSLHLPDAQHHENAPSPLAVEDCPICDLTDADGCPACDATGALIIRVAERRDATLTH